MEKETLYKNAAEYGALHNEDCCVNTEYGCDGGTATLGCCENMQMVKSIVDHSVSRVFEYVSHDMRWDSEEQRKAAVEMYVNP